MTDEEREAIAQGLENWEQATLKRVLDRTKEMRESFTTESGIPVKRIYTPLDLDGTSYRKDLSFPGEYHTPGAYTQRCSEVASGP